MAKHEGLLQKRPEDVSLSKSLRSLQHLRVFRSLQSDMLFTEECVPHVLPTPVAEVSHQLTAKNSKLVLTANAKHFQYIEKIMKLKLRII